ncbi:MAG: small acid-soluble spore protein H-type [Herbinix sp.]|jgi:small acid-soluble spore protein H (minor)|nr:small acid-soluble spore protein H-type [Herbinix sp.]
MNKERAEQIASSPEMIDVTYNGDLVYIEKVNPTKDTASIHSLKQPQNTREVNVTQLVEAK